MARKLLIIDDDTINREILREIFEGPYDTDEAGDGLEGLGKIRSWSPDAILLDYLMPKMDGLELLEVLASNGTVTKTPVFLITAEAGGEVTRRAYELGVMDVIAKPVVPHIARRRIDSVVELFEKRKALERTVDEQAEELLKRAERIIALNYGMIEALATAIEFRSGESGSHVRRIHDITLHFLSNTRLGDGFSDEEKRQMALASIMHDVGKIAIPDAILNKPGRLTPEEFETMKGHTVKGAELLDGIPQFRELDAYAHARDIALHHHERWDGGGYPEGLKGDEISVPAQIVALADVYDALQSPRCYKAAIPREEAVAMIAEGRCGAFNPDLIEIFKAEEPGLREAMPGAWGES